MYTVVALGSWLVAALILRSAGYRLFRIEPVTIFFLLAAVYIGVAHVLVSAWYDGSFNFMGLDVLFGSQQYAGPIIVYIAGFIMCFAAGVATERVAIAAAVPAVQTSSELVTGNRSDFSVLQVVLWSLWLVSVAFALKFFVANGVPVFAADPDAARYAAVESGGYKWLLPAYFYGNPFVTVICLGLMLSRQLKPAGRATWVILLLASACLQATSIFAGFRAFIVTYVVVVVAVISLFRPTRMRSVAVAGAIGVAVIVLITWLKYSNTDQALLIVAAKLLHRVVLDSFYTLRIVFTIFDGRHPLLGASVWWDLYSKLPGQQLTFQGFLTSQWTNSTEYSIALAPTLAGEFFANAKWAGIVLAYAFGFGLAFVADILREAFQRSSESSVALLVLYALTCIFAERSVSVGIGGVIFLCIVWFALLGASLAGQGILLAAARSVRKIRATSGSAFPPAEQARH